MHGFWTVFEARDGLNPLSAKKRTFSEKRRQSRFFQGLIHFSRYPILRKTKRDIGKKEREIGQIKREIISTKRALVAIKRAIVGTPSPLPRGGSAAIWDKIALRFSPIRGCREGFRDAFLLV